MDSWCTIESDPGVFTELIQAIGVEDIQVEELYSLDDDSLEAVKPVYGLVFLFKYIDDTPEVEPKEAPGVFFAKQVITNACATQAILAILLNHSSIKLGRNLADFREFTKDFPPDLKGLAISNSEQIRIAHNGFARPEPFSFEMKTARQDDDAFHFISYVPVNGRLYELDGLQPNPIDHGECTFDNWLKLATPVIQKRINKYSNSEIRFNLMAIIKDRKTLILESLNDLEKRRECINRMKLKQPIENGRERIKINEKTIFEELPLEMSEEKCDEELQRVIAEEQKLGNQLKNEKNKSESWRIENIRRKHNYIPFIVNFAKILAKKGELTGLVDQAKN